MDGRFFSFRSHGIIQKPRPEEEKPSVSTPEHTLTGDDIFIPSDEIIDFSDVKTEAKDSVHNVVDLEDAKVIDRENEGILEFDAQGSVIQQEKKKKPKIKRVTTIRDYVKRLDEKEAATMDYIDIDDDEPGKRVFREDRKRKESKEPVPELDYMAYDDETPPEVVNKAEPIKEEEGPRSTIDCPHCSETIEIPSSKRPVTLKCPGCGKKGVLRI